MNVRLAFLVVLAFASCKSAAVVETPAPSDCIVIDGGHEAGDSLVLGNDIPPIDLRPNVVAGTPTAVDLVESQLTSAYAFRVDCTGRLVPELFTSWEREGDVWVMRPVGASLASRRTLAETLRSRWDSTIADDKPFTGLDVDEEGNLLIAVKRGGGTPPTELSSHPFNIDVAVAGGILYQPGVRVEDVRDVDPRNLAGSTIDILVTDDMEVVDFAADREDLQVAPLPPDRIYAFISVTRASGSPTAMETAPLDLTGAVTAGSVASIEDAWWTSSPECQYPVDSVDTVAAGGTQYYKIAYPGDDSIARGLAERMIALPQVSILDSSYTNHFVDSIPGFRERRHLLKTEAMSREDLSNSIRDGNAFGYILALPSTVPDTCTFLNELEDLFGWLTPRNMQTAVIPLVFSAPHLITGQRVPPIERDSQNRLFFSTDARNNP